MNDVLFGNTNGRVLKKLAARSLRAGKNYIAILAIALATLLFTSLFTIAQSISSSIEDNEFRTVGSSAHVCAKLITENEYETLITDERIAAYGKSVVFGYAVGDCFRKLPTEVRYADEHYAQWGFCMPDEGSLPKKENEMAASRLVLEAMGFKEAEVGTAIELTFDTDTQTITDTFTLSGIWEGDTVSPAQMILLSEAYMEKVAPPVTGISTGDTAFTTGYIDCVMMLSSPWNISGQAEDIAASYSFGDRIGVNEGYAAANVSISGILPVLAGILVIFAAGYLLIYNVFYISIAQEIRFYGMLKTLGTTARQLRRIVYKKAARLALCGIPLGLLLGWPIGRLLVPSIIRMFSGNMHVITTAHPLIFVVAVLFALLTVFISCGRPAALAARVSSMEALKYVEQPGMPRRKRRERHRRRQPSCGDGGEHWERGNLPGRRHVNPLMLARQNFGRNKRKAAIVTLSFALSLVLLNSVYTYVTSFDFDKFVSNYSLADFTVADASVFNPLQMLDTAGVSRDFIAEAKTLDGLENLGNVYTQTLVQPLDEGALEALAVLPRLSGLETADIENYRARGSHGVNIYGLDPWPAQYLQAVEGNLEPERWQSGQGIYVTALEMVGSGTQPLYHPGDSLDVTCADGTVKSYEILAVVTIPAALRSPMWIDMGMEYVLPTEEYLQVAGDPHALPMKTMYNVDDAHIQSADQWLQYYTANVEPTLDYYSKVTLRESFRGLTAMYGLVGGVLCAVLALIGLLNFINSMMTSILSRYREIAMLQSVGMTGRQVKEMLIFEGLSYAFWGLAVSIVLAAAASITIVKMMGAELSYFTWRFTLLPVAACILPLVAVTALSPCLCSRKMSQKTGVERLRTGE